MQTIFVVDDNNVNLLLANKALHDHYRVFTLPSALNMFELLEDVKPDLILLDVMMPEMNGYEALKRLKANDQYAGIPVFFLTASEDEAAESEGAALGATGLIHKPFSQQALLDRIKSHLENSDK